MKTKICTKCKKELSATIEYFHKQKYGKYGLKSQCKTCTAEYKKIYRQKNIEKILKIDREKSRLYRKNNPNKAAEYRKTHKPDSEQMWKYNLKRRYNMTVEDYNEMFKKQDGKCKICNKPEYRRHHSGKITRMGVDHDHDTGKVRGLLCNNCNRKIGVIEEYKKDPVKWDIYLN